jgi:lipoprotein NlpD
VTEPQVKPTPSPPKASDDVAVNGAGGLVWRWPGKGPLIGSFVAGDQTRQGIDIGGTAGDPVLAAADGEVVYSGNGLLGYGELIIVKHNANFLSAYGHNRKRLVQEGDRIKSGQQIAEMGSSASARDELHFEIRKNGKPVNPIDYLPARWREGSLLRHRCRDGYSGRMGLLPSAAELETEDLFELIDAIEPQDEET